MRLSQSLAALLLMLVLGQFSPAAAAAPDPIEVRVVVVTTWEYEPDGKDLFGELQAWQQRWPLETRIPFPAGNHELRYDPKTHVLAILTGMQTTRAAVSITALGFDPRFDLSHAYWVVAGTAGVNPKVASLGSAAWMRWIVDGDLVKEIDIRDAPKDWPIGIIPYGRSEPYQPPTPPIQSFQANMAYQLNVSLADWALALTRDVPLADDPKLAEIRARYTGEAAQPPFVLEGAGLMSSRFKYGDAFGIWAERWVDYWTSGKDVYTMGAQEDSGIMQAMTQLSNGGRMKIDRVLILRAGDGYSRLAPGETAMGRLTHGSKESPAGMVTALENLYRVASPVVRYLEEHWATTRDTVPGK